MTTPTVSSWAFHPPNMVRDRETQTVLQMTQDEYRQVLGSGGVITDELIEEFDRRAAELVPGASAPLTFDPLNDPNDQGRTHDIEGDNRSGRRSPRPGTRPSITDENLGHPSEEAFPPNTSEHQPGKSPDGDDVRGEEEAPALSGPHINTNSGLKPGVVTSSGVFLDQSADAVAKAEAVSGPLADANEAERAGNLGLPADDDVMDRLVERTEQVHAGEASDQDTVIEEAKTETGDATTEANREQALEAAEATAAQADADAGQPALGQEGTSAAGAQEGENVSAPKRSTSRSRSTGDTEVETTTRTTTKSSKK